MLSPRVVPPDPPGPEWVSLVTTDAQWALIEPLLPEPAWLAGKGGQPKIHCRREIVNTIFCLVDNGITWRGATERLSSWSTVYNYFAVWEATGVTQDVLTRSATERDCAQAARQLRGRPGPRFRFALFADEVALE